MFIQPPNELDAKFPAAPCSRDRNARYPQSYTLPHTRVKPGFGKVPSAIAAEGYWDVGHARYSPSVTKLNATSRDAITI